MSLLVTAVTWFFLVIFVAVSAICSLVVGYLYGRFSQNTSAETAARWTNILTGATGFLAGVVIWVVGNAGLLTLGDGFIDTVVTILASATAAIVVAVATITAILHTNPELPGVDHVPTVRRHYLRYLTVLFVFVFLLASGILIALEGSPVGLVLLILGFWCVVWAGAPLLSGLSARTRRPTDDEQARIDLLLESVDLSVRDIRIVEADDRYLAVELSGAPGGRFLFVSSSALETFSDETLQALLAARREQAAYYQDVISMAPYIIPLIWVVLAVNFEVVSLLPATMVAIVVGAIGLAGVRIFRYFIDARTADTVGSEPLADAFERAAAAAGVDLEDRSKRSLISRTPPLGARIDRLRKSGK